MAKITTCDGNGTEIAEDTPTTGMFGHQYCDEMRPVAEAYMAALSDLHARHAEKFTAELTEIRAHYKAKLRELPDQP